MLRIHGEPSVADPRSVAAPLGLRPGYWTARGRIKRPFRDVGVGWWRSRRGRPAPVPAARRSGWPPRSARTAERRAGFPKPARRRRPSALAAPTGRASTSRGRHPPTEPASPPCGAPSTRTCSTSMRRADPFSARPKSPKKGLCAHCRPQWIFPDRLGTHDLSRSRRRLGHEWHGRVRPGEGAHAKWWWRSGAVGHGVDLAPLERHPGAQRPPRQRGPQRAPPARATRDAHRSPGAGAGPYRSPAAGTPCPDARPPGPRTPPARSRPRRTRRALAAPARARPAAARSPRQPGPRSPRPAGRTRRRSGHPGRHVLVEIDGEQRSRHLTGVVGERPVRHAGGERGNPPWPGHAVRARLPPAPGRSRTPTVISAMST